MRTALALIVGLALLLGLPVADARSFPAGSRSGVTGIKVRIASASIPATAEGQQQVPVRIDLTADVDSRIISAFTRAAKKVTLVPASGRAGDLIDIESDKPTTLAPPGAHLLLEGLYAPLAKGSTVTINMTLFGKDGQRQAVEVYADVI